MKITPRGWLKTYLETQMEGLTGHIGEAGFPYDSQFWGADALPQHKSITWWPFEQTGYHIDGFVRTAILLGDVKRAEDMIYPILAKADRDGYIGHAQFKDIEDNDTRWAHAVFFRACLALYDANGDKAILEALTKHYLGYPVDYHEIRNVQNVEIMAELYRLTGNRALLDMAVKAYEDGLNEEEARLISCVGKVRMTVLPKCEE